MIVADEVMTITIQELSPTITAVEVIDCAAVTSHNNCSTGWLKIDYFMLRLNVPVNNFSVMSGRSHRFLGN